MEGRARGRGLRGTRGAGAHRGVQGRQDVEFFREYTDLEAHFREKHLLCRDPKCLALRYVVFATNDEYRVHFVHQHAGRLQRSDRAQLLSVTKPMALPFPAPQLPPASLATSPDGRGTSSATSSCMHVNFASHGDEGRGGRQGRSSARGTCRRGRGMGRAGSQLGYGGSWSSKQAGGDEAQSGEEGVARGGGERGGRRGVRGMRRGEERGRGRVRREVSGSGRARWGEDGRVQALGNGMHLGINVTQLRERYALELGASGEGGRIQAPRRELEGGERGESRSDQDRGEDYSEGRGGSRAGRVVGGEDSEVEFPSLVPKVLAPPEWEGLGSGGRGTDRATGNGGSGIRWEQSMASRLFDATEIDLGAGNDGGGSGGLSGGTRQNDFPPLPNATGAVPSSSGVGTAAGGEDRGAGGAVVTNQVIAILSALGVSEAHVKVKSKKAAHGLGKMSPPGARRAVGPGVGGKFGGVDVGWSRERVTGQQESELGKKRGVAEEGVEGVHGERSVEQEEFPGLPRGEIGTGGVECSGASGWQEIVKELVGEGELGAMKRGLSALRRGDVTAAACYAANAQSFESLGQVMLLLLRVPLCSFICIALWR
jgi:hypothetical protein